MRGGDDEEEAFLSFAHHVEPALRLALVAAYGVDRGLEAANDALVYAWQHWTRVRGLENPAGYLYRVGQRLAGRRRLPLLIHVGPADAEASEPWVEPGLSKALGALSARQRQVVVLMRCYSWTHSEVAELLGIRVSSVQTHLERGLQRLRGELGVRADERHRS